MVNNTMQGFIKGFFFALLVLILTGAFASPLIGRAQDGETPNNLIDRSSDPDGRPGRTDDPQGQQLIPLGDVVHPPNDSYTAGDGALPSNRTDDPLGRTRIPLAKSEAPNNNSVYTMQSDAPFDPEQNQAAMAREAALQQEASQQYTSPLVIPAGDFSDDGFDPDSAYFSFGGGFFNGNADAYGCLVAPAYLPAGATVTDMFVSAYDNDSTFNLTINLRRTDNFTGAITDMATANTTGTFSGVQTISDATITEPLILYPDYSYYLTTCLLSGDIRLYSARLYYTVP